LGVYLEKSLEKKVPLREWEKLTPSWDLEDKLPWDNISVGVNREYLKNEYLKAIKGDLTPWCETFGCYQCGACDKEI
ncbi:MAG TPA: radical SAM protein, partial [Methanobacterium sp.]|nr:radical SAM protein [Methanobacterium sp.]